MQERRTKAQPGRSEKVQVEIMFNRQTKVKGLIAKTSYLSLLAVFCLPVALAEQSTSVSQVASAVSDVRFVEDLLKKHYKVANPLPSSANQFSVLVPRASKRKVLDWFDGKYKVRRVEGFDDGGFFRRQKILVVTVDYVLLEAQIIPGRSSKGFFALNRKNLTYLNGQDSLKNVEAVLRHEHRPLEQADATVLAQFFAQTILRQNNNKLVVGQPLDDLLKHNEPDMRISNEKLTRKCACGRFLLNWKNTGR